MRLQGRGALVTGGSRGLGAAVAELLAAKGMKVALVARDEGPLAATVARIRAAGGLAHAICGDVGLKEDAHRIVGAAAALVGPIDLLVNNASTLGPVPLRLLLDTDCETLEQTLAVNLVGPFRLIKLVAGAMLLRGEGVVVNITSDAAVEAYPRWGAYGLSKAALEHLTRTLAAELEDGGVRFWSVDPGDMDTAMHAAALPDADRASLARPEAVAQRLVRLIEAAERPPNGARVALQSAQAAEVTP